MRNSKNMCRNNGDDDERDTNTHTHPYKHKHSCPIVATLSPLIGNLWMREGANEWEKKRAREWETTRGFPSPFHSQTDGRQSFAAKIKMERTSVTKTKRKSKNKLAAWMGSRWRRRRCRRLTATATRRQYSALLWGWAAVWVASAWVFLFFITVFCSTNDSSCRLVCIEWACERESKCVLSTHTPPQAH